MTANETVTLLSQPCRNTIALALLSSTQFFVMGNVTITRAQNNAVDVKNTFSFRSKITKGIKEKLSSVKNTLEIGSSAPSHKKAL